MFSLRYFFKNDGSEWAADDYSSFLLLFVYWHFLPIRDSWLAKLE